MYLQVGQKVCPIDLLHYKASIRQRCDQVLDGIPSKHLQQDEVRLQVTVTIPKPRFKEEARTERLLSKSLVSTTIASS